MSSVCKARAVKTPPSICHPTPKPFIARELQLLCHLKLGHDAYQSVTVLFVTPPCHVTSLCPSDKQRQAHHCLMREARDLIISSHLRCYSQIRHSCTLKSQLLVSPPQFDRKLSPKTAEREHWYLRIDIPLFTTSA